MYYILKNSLGLYWSKENNYTPYPTLAKLYKYEDALKAAYRKGCRVFSITYTINADYSFFIEECNEIDI